MIQASSSLRFYASQPPRQESCASSRTLESVVICFGIYFETHILIHCHTDLQKQHQVSTKRLDMATSRQHRAFGERLELV